jgi:hypothetical protein
MSLGMTCRLVPFSCASYRHDHGNFVFRGNFAAYPYNAVKLRAGGSFLHFTGGVLVMAGWCLLFPPQGYPRVLCGRG